MVERAARPSEATSIGLPWWWHGIGVFAENFPEIGLKGLKAAATIPLMTLAFVLTPTPAGKGSTMDQYVLNVKPTPEKNSGEFKRLPGNQGWVHKKRVKYTRRAIQAMEMQAMSELNGRYGQRGLLTLALIPKNQEKEPHSIKMETL